MQRVVRAEDVAEMGITEILLHVPQDLPELPQAGAVDPRSTAGRGGADRLSGCELPAGEALRRGGRAGGVVCEPAALGVEAAAAALGAGAGGPDAGDLSV